MIVSKSRLVFFVTLGVMVATVLATACTSDDPPAISVEEELESIAGQELTPADVERQLDVASTLCRVDLSVLHVMWESMSADQMRFQDYVFGRHCPERSVEYALATGRSLTPEAHGAVNNGSTTTSGPGPTLPLPTQPNPTSADDPSTDSLPSSTQPTSTETNGGNDG